MSDHENPFASGSAAKSPFDDDHSALSPVDMEVGAILGRAWEIFMANPGVVLGAVLLPLIPAILFGLIDFGFQLAELSNDNDETVALLLSLGSLGTNLVSQLVNLFFQLGAIRIFLQLSRGHHAEIGMLVSEGANLLSAVGTVLLMGLIVIVGFVLLIVPGFIAIFGLQFSLYVLVDRGYGPIESLQESWRLTDGYKLTIFAINLLLGLLALAVACLTLGFGYILALPVMALVAAVMYQSLVHIQGGPGGDLSKGLGL